MSDEKIVLIARLKVREDAVERAKELALGIVGPSREEEGCHNYDVHQQLDDPTVFVWHETWRDRTALDEHFGKSYFQEFFAEAGALAAEPPLIMQTRMIS